MAANITVILSKDETQITQTGKCTITGETYSVTASTEQFKSWRRGMLIQKAMPNLNAEQREFLISGTTPEEWKELWKGIDKEEEDE